MFRLIPIKRRDIRDEGTRADFRTVLFGIPTFSVGTVAKTGSSIDRRVVLNN